MWMSIIKLGPLFRQRTGNVEYGPNLLIMFLRKNMKLCAMVKPVRCANGTYGIETSIALMSAVIVALHISLSAMHAIARQRSFG